MSTQDGDATVLAVSSRDMTVETLSSTIDDAARGSRSIHLEIGGASREAIVFEFTVYGRVPFFELAPTTVSQAAFWDLFQAEVFKPALADRYVPSPHGTFSPWRWCFAGVIGDIAEFDPSGACTAVDPTGVFAAFEATTHHSAPSVDIVLGSEHITWAPVYIGARDGAARVFAKTLEVGRPINFQALTTLITSRGETLRPHDIAFWRHEVHHKFPEVYASESEAAPRTTRR